MADCRYAHADESAESEAFAEHSELGLMRQVPRLAQNSSVATARLKLNAPLCEEIGLLIWDYLEHVLREARACRC